MARSFPRAPESSAFGCGALLGGAVGGGGGGGARLDHGFERLALVAHVALHGLEHVGDEVGAALELDVDPRPALLAELPVLDEAVVEHHAVGAGSDDDDENDQASHGGTPGCGGAGPHGREIVIRT